jgi:hypothetical protein
MESESRQNLTHRRPSVLSDGTSSSSRSSGDLMDGASIDFLALGASHQHPRQQHVLQRPNPSVCVQTGEYDDDPSSSGREMSIDFNGKIKGITDERSDVSAGVDDPARSLAANNAYEEDDDVITLNIDESLLGRDSGNSCNIRLSFLFLTWFYRCYK